MIFRMTSGERDPRGGGRKHSVAMLAAWALSILLPALALAQDAPQPAQSPLPATIGNPTLPHDLSPWGMFLNADIVVKVVMVGLVFASLVTWTIWLAKVIELHFAKRRTRSAVIELQQVSSLAAAVEKLGGAGDPVAHLLRAAMAEAQSSEVAGDGLKERVAWLLERIEATAARRIGRGMGFLASIGATAPFVGLFGTVWGIMNSFIGISNAHTTNLAVVAPGIAQALLATAFGLVAAIPAVMIYNVLARSTAHYRALLGDASAQVMRLVSRDLDRAKSVPMPQAAE